MRQVQRRSLQKKAILKRALRSLGNPGGNLRVLCDALGQRLEGVESIDAFEHLHVSNEQPNLKVSRGQLKRKGRKAIYIYITVSQRKDQYKGTFLQSKTCYF